MPKKKDEKAKAKDYPNLKPYKKEDDGLTITKADFETRRIQAMAAVAAADRRYQNFWRAVRFGNQYMLAFGLAGLAASYRKADLLAAIGPSTDYLSWVAAFIIGVLGFTNLMTWKHLYDRMMIAIRQEEDVTQIQSEANANRMTWSTKQHFMVQMVLMMVAASLWFHVFESF